MGDEDQRPVVGGQTRHQGLDGLEVEVVVRLVEQGLDEGALGIGINAGYAPGYGRKEYFALAELAAERGVAAKDTVVQDRVLGQGSRPKSGSVLGSGTSA